MNRREEKIAEGLKLVAEHWLAPYLASLVDGAMASSNATAPVSKAEAAKLLNVSTRTIERMARDGELRAAGAGKLRFSRLEIERLQRSRPSK
ncbi:MAG: hypothetical protein CMJ58_16995 [Planctomycetaceae bacterium]|nr:hypothetical protein [Planctomycetaceae bacterium]